MASSNDLEVRLCTTIAPMLLAVAVFSLGAAGLSTIGKGTVLDELLFAVALVSVLSSALLIDHVLDEMKIASIARLSFLGHGYVAFCFVVSFVAALIPIQYHAKYHPGQMPGIALGGAVFALGACVFLKLMTFRDSNIFIVGIILSAAASAALLAP